MPANISHSEDFILEPKRCFILGILQRSGTNYIYRLLTKHPDCSGPGPIYEDFLVHNSEMLKNYANGVHKMWDPKWEVDKKIGPPETLLHYLGDALSRFLKLQLTQSAVIQPPSTQVASEKNRPKIQITKTPSVKGLDNFFDLFPDDYLIIIIRDGRAVVESGVRSFGWNYESAMRNWAVSAQAILDFKEKYGDSDKKFLILKYEDIFKDEKAELLKVFDFLGLESERFDFDRAKSMGVTGSSELKEQGSDLHWKSTERSKDFNPLERFSNWDRRRHDRFNWICGSCMTKFEYGLQEVSSNRHLYIVRNMLLDFIWYSRVISLKIIRRLRKIPLSLVHS